MSRRRSSPSPASLRKDRLILYGRRGCHLCDEMEAALAARGVAFDKVNVDADRALVERYGLRVPVLTDSQGAELCYGRLDPAKIQ